MNSADHAPPSVAAVELAHAAEGVSERGEGKGEGVKGGGEEGVLGVGVVREAGVPGRGGPGVGRGGVGGLGGLRLVEVGGCWCCTC